MITPRKAPKNTQNLETQKTPEKPKIPKAENPAKSNTLKQENQETIN